LTRSELIVEIMAQVYEVTDESDSSLRRNVEYRLRLTDTRVLRDIYACNSVQEEEEMRCIHCLYDGSPDEDDCVDLSEAS
jgi:hypothetical protein